MPLPLLPWYRIRLSREECEGGEFVIVQYAFRETFIARNGPRGAALYVEWEPGGRGCLLYFTPQTAACARALFRIYGAEPCEAPRTGRLQLIYGDDSVNPLHGGVAF